jgi:hypothetical protein
VNPYDRENSSGWDTYWVSWIDDVNYYGLRARSNSAESIATFWPAINDTIQSQISQILWQPIGGDVDAGTWAAQHVYFGDGSLTSQGKLFAGVQRSGADGSAQPIIFWTDDAGDPTTIATGTAVSIASVKTMITTIDLGTGLASVYLDGGLVCSGALPAALLSTNRRGVGLKMKSSDVAEAVRSYGGPVMRNWGVGGASTVAKLTLGYVPNELPGGTIGDP